MKKVLAISLIPVFSLFVLGAFVALPAHAEGPVEGCTLVRDVSVKTSAGADARVLKGTVVTSGTTEFVSGDQGGPTTSLALKDWGTVCVVNTINTVVDWVFIFLLVVSVGLIAVAGFMYMTGGAAPDQQKKAMTMITAAVVGIVIAILARIIPALVTGILL